MVVAVVDTGVDLDHPDLSFNIWTNYDEIPANGIDDDGNGFVDDYHGASFAGGPSPQDDHGHGTHCAGIAAAVTNNRVGVAGVAGGAKIMPVKSLNRLGRGYWDGIAAGIIYAADNGAEVINLSLGGSYASQVVEAACDYARDRGATVIAAAGNSATSATPYPAGFNSVVAVSATDHNDWLAEFSNFGSWIDVSAPGGGHLLHHADGGGDAEHRVRLSHGVRPHVGDLHGDAEHVGDGGADPLRATRS